MNAPDTVRAILIGSAVAVPVAFLLALLYVSMQRREPIPWGALWRALTGRR
jgi:hypothetical protein